MNKAKIIIELSNIKSEIMNRNLTVLPARTAFRESMEKKLDKVIVDLLDGGQTEGQLLEAKVGRVCEDCSILKKAERLADAIDQGYMISKEIKIPFTITCVEREVKK